MTATTANGKAKGFCGSAPAGWVTSNNDCCDTGDVNKQVHPGQTAWFSAAGPCGGFDYDCDGSMTPQYPPAGACDLTVCAAGFVADTACGASGSYQTCDAIVPVVCAAPASMAQACH